MGEIDLRLRGFARSVSFVYEAKSFVCVSGYLRLFVA